MQKFIRQFLDFLLFSNLFIAFAAAAQVIFTYQLLAAEPNYLIIALVLFATLCFYNFSPLLSRPKNPQNSPYLRVRWIFSHSRLLKSFALISLLAVIVFSFFISFKSRLILFILALVSLAYHMPVWRIKDHKAGLRHIPGMKLFLIASVWSLTVVLLPVLESNNGIPELLFSEKTAFLLAQRFAFIAAITIPFDIRDIYQDKFYELKTIPVLLGESRAYMICLIFLVSSLAFSAMPVFPTSTIFAAILLTICLTAWLIFKSSGEKNEYYYLLYLDGTLILPAVFTEFFKFLAV